MRKINLELNAAKLATKKLQLAQVEAQLNNIKAKLTEVQSRFEAKQIEVQELSQVLTEAVSKAE